MDSLKNINYDDIRADIRKMITFNEKRYLTNISWTVDQKPEDAEKFENNKFRPLTDDEWNEVHHKDCNNAYLIVPLTRFLDVTEVIPLGREITAKHVIGKIYDFYHTPLSQQQIDDIENFPNDCLGYNEELVKSASKGNVARYVDLRGAAIYFEGIQRVAGNVYKAQFGS